MPPHPLQPLRWDIFCRVIDNHGDAGVCWRLAADLGARGHAVRLVIDDDAPLAWMAPTGAPGVQVLPWPEDGAALAAGGAPGDVVIEAFGCDPPTAFVQRMAAAPRPPVWINLEYLSAEDWVERSHGLPSPQANGLTKWFLFPGFTPLTGGLLREPGLLAARERFDGRAWLAAQGWAARPGERVVLLFSYANPMLPALCTELARAPTLLLVAPGPAQSVLSAPSTLPAPGGLRVQPLPFVSQPDFDRLLWSADLNLVRGEDSLVRAIWAGAPFVWQAYPQQDGVHHDKVEALLRRMALQAPNAEPVAEPVAEPMAEHVAALWRAWNGRPGSPWPGSPWPGLPPLQPWRAATRAFCAAQAALLDLAGSLEAFVQARRGGPTSCS